MDSERSQVWQYDTYSDQGTVQQIDVSISRESEGGTQVREQGGI